MGRRVRADSGIFLCQFKRREEKPGVVGRKEVGVVASFVESCCFNFI